MVRLLSHEKAHEKAMKLGNGHGFGNRRRAEGRSPFNIASFYFFAT